jgi:hypothetical protein
MPSIAKRGGREVETALVRFLRELKVPGLVAVIVITVWISAYCQRMDDRARVYRIPAARVFAAQEAESETENDVAVSAAPVEPLDQD